MSRREQIRTAAEKASRGVGGNWEHIRKGAELWFIHGALWADSHPRWIPVEERLPEETEVVLGVREGGTDVEMYKFMGFNESTNTFDWEWHPYYRAVVDDVTNWMEIVPPRKEEE